jgi:hypothetical protein
LDFGCEVENEIHVIVTTNYLQGDVHKKPLSSMYVDDVVRLVGSITGLNRRMLPSYTQRLVENNITGAVLMSCDLSELKPVLQMAFGDWELLRTLLEWMRLQELQSGEVDACDADVVVNRTSRSAASDELQTKAGSLSQKNVSLGTKISTSNDVLAVQTSSMPSMKARSVREDRVDCGGDIVTPTLPSPSGGVLKPLNRQDSFVNEVLMENEALRGVIHASGIGSDSEADTPTGDEAETQRIISPIPEEPVMSRNSSVVSFSASTKVIPALSRQVSLDSVSTSPGDRAFTVGPDNDSGESDSEEVERLSRKSSVAHRKGAAPQSGARHDDLKTDVEAQGGVLESLPPPAEKRKSSMKASKYQADPPVRKSAMGKLTESLSSGKSKSGAKSERRSESTMPLMTAYFPMAFDGAGEKNTAAERGGARHSGASISPSHTSSKLTSQSSVSSDTGVSHKQDARVSSASGQRSRQSSVDGSAQTKSAEASAVSVAGPAAGKTVQQTASSKSSEPHELLVQADEVKFFIEDETASPDSVVSTDVVFELQSMPPSDVGFSNAGTKKTDKGAMFL